MLGKLLKYEFQATSRTFFPIYIAILLVSIINRVFRRANVDMGFTLTVFVLVGLFIALGVITLIMIIQRFNKNLLSDEGYLMFTLPVKSSNLIFSKLFVSFIWTIISGIIAVSAFLILLADANFFKTLGEVFSSTFWENFVKAMQMGIDENPVLMLVRIGFIGILGYSEVILAIYLALAVGQLPKFSKHRVIASFIAYFVIVTVEQWAVMIAGITVGPHLMIDSNMMLNIVLVATIVLNIVYFSLTNFILKKHLNLA